MNLKLEDLEIYKLSIEIGEMVWRIVINWPPFEKKLLANSLWELPISLPLTLARAMEDFIIKTTKNFAITAGVLQKKHLLLFKKQAPEI